MSRSREVSTLLVVLLSLAGGAIVDLRAAAQEALGKRLAWPSPPAEPVVVLDRVLKKLTNFEVAVQGATDGTLPRVEKLKRPAGIDFDQRGRLLVTDSRQGLLLRLDLDLGVALVFGSASTPALEHPLGVTSGGDGTIFVADAGLGQVVAFATSGKVVATYGGGSLVEPVDVALSADGSRLFVADSKADRIVVFDTASREETERFGSRGKGMAEFYSPGGLEVDRDGNLLVVDRLNARVQVFEPSGAFTRAIHGSDRAAFSRPRDLAVDASGRVFVTDEAQSLVQIYGSDLEPLLAFGRDGLGDGEFLGIGGIAASGDRLAVVDQAGGRVQTFRLPGIETAAAPVEPVPASTESTTARVANEAAAPRELPEPGTPPERPAADPDPTETRTGPEPGPTPAPEATPAPRVSPEATPPTTEVDVEGLLIDLIGDWAAAWSAQDVERYLPFYAADFLPANGMSRDRWSAERRRRIEAPSSIEVAVEAAEVDLLSPNRAEVTFLQSYRSDLFSDRVRKTLVMVGQDGDWKIVAETVLEAL